MMNLIRRLLLPILCIVLIATMVLLTAGFSASPPVEIPATEAPSSAYPTEPIHITEPINADAPTDAIKSVDVTEPTIPLIPDVPADVTVKGEGKLWFYCNVTDLDGTMAKFLIKTDKQILSEALLELELITGEPYYNQLNITSVNGIPADPDMECAYWHFYINGRRTVIHIGETATQITPGATYAFEKRISYVDKGNGSTTFYLDALKINGTITKYRIHTDKKTLGEALKEYGLIHALYDNGGWYIVTVDGIPTAQGAGTYWDLYINGKYASTGIDMYATQITPDATYRFAKMTASV